MSEWKKKPLGDICVIKTGNKDVNQGSEGGKYPFFTCAQKIYKIDNYVFDGEAILIAGNGFFNVKYYNGKFDAYQRTYVLMSFTEFGKYVFRYIQFKLDDITSDNRGSTIRYIRIGDLSNYKIPLPPTIEEQRKIVEQLEQLLGKINSANERLNKIPALLKRFRQSVLSAACSGRLTDDWREGKELVEWENKRIGDVFNTQLGKMLSKKAFEPDLTMLPYLRNANVQWGKIDVNDVLEMGFSEREIKKFTLELGDLIMCEGGDIGRCAIWKNQLENCLYQKALHRVRPKDNKEVTTKWLFYYFNLISLDGRLYEGISETTIKHLPQDRLVEILIPLPPLPEQEEIVRRVDMLFGLADKVEARYNAVKTALSRAERAVYAKVFRGEM